MRRLATFAASCSAAIFLAHYFLPPVALLPLAGLCLILSGFAFLFHGKLRLRILLILVAAALGLLAGHISYAQKTAPSVELSGQTVSFSAEVTEYPRIYDSFASVTVSLKDADMPRVDALLYFSDYSVPELSPGDLISVTGKFKFSGEKYGEDWDGQLAKGIFLSCYPDSVEVTGRSTLAFLYFPKDIQRAIGAMVLKIMPEDAAPFMLALLTGDSSLFYADTQTASDMSAAGILHVISVSGMHVAFLVGFVRLLVRRKKTSSLICIPAVWIFAAVAGGDPAILRAAFMQSMVLVAPLIRRENDGLTSLTAILAILLLINPYACASVSLQLSFSAMLGMILVTQRVNKSLLKKLPTLPKGKKSGLGRKIVVAIIASFAASVGAMVFAAPLIAWHFRTFAVYAIFANILVFSAISACFILGYVACFLGMLWLPLGIGAGAVAGLITTYIKAAARFIAALPFSSVYVSQGYFQFWLVFSYVVFGAWAFWRRSKKGFRPILPTMLVFSAFLVGVIITQPVVEKLPSSFTAVDVGQGQSLVLSSGGSVAVIDCGGKGTLANAGDTVAEFLTVSGFSSVDALCITHFDEDHVNGAMRLISKLHVKNLFVAAEGLQKERRAEILEFAEAQGVQIHVVEANTEIVLGDILLRALRPLSRTNPELIFLASSGDYDILVTGDAYEDSERLLLLSHDLPDIELFVAGHHGSKHSSSDALLAAITAETAVISCGYNNYGHPAVEVLERFAAADMEVLRTDLHGNVTITLP